MGLDPPAHHPDLGGGSRGKLGMEMKSPEGLFREISPNARSVYPSITPRFFPVGGAGIYGEALVGPYQPSSQICDASRGPAEAHSDG